MTTNTTNLPNVQISEIQTQFNLTDAQVKAVIDAFIVINSESALTRECYAAIRAVLQGQNATELAFLSSQY